MTVKELSEYLRLDRMTIYKMLKEGSIPASRIGHQWRFFRSDIDEWLRSLRTTRRMAVLVLEGGAALADVLSQGLPRPSYELVTVQDAEEAREAVYDRSFDVAFLELDRSSAELVRELRQIDPELPVVLVVTGADGKLLEQALEAGAVTVVRMPASADDVRRAMALVPRRRNAAPR